jgi:hypothetical protein
MSVTTATFAKTVGNTDFEKPLFIESDKKFWDDEKLFDHGKTNRAETPYYPYTGFGAAQEVGELGEMHFEDPAEGEEVKLLVHKNSIGTSLSEEAEDDNRNLPGLLQKWGKAFGRSHEYKRALDVAARINNAFSTSDAEYAYTNFADTTEAIFANTHTVYNGSTYDNLFPAASMDYETLQDMARYFLTGIVDEQGLPVTTKVAKFFYAADLDTDARLFFKTRKGAPGTADHDINTLPEPDMVPCRLFSPTTMFGMCSSEAKEYMIFRNRKPLKTKWWDDNEHNGRKVNSWCRYGAKILDPRFMIASQGN